MPLWAIPRIDYKKNRGIIPLINVAALILEAERTRSHLVASINPRSLYQGATESVSLASGPITDLWNNNPDIVDIQPSDTRLIALEAYSAMTQKYEVRGYHMVWAGQPWQPDANLTYWLSEDSGLTLSRLKLLNHYRDRTGDGGVLIALFEEV